MRPKFRVPRQISQNSKQLPKIDHQSSYRPKSVRSTPSELGERAVCLQFFFVKKIGYSQRMGQPFNNVIFLILSNRSIHQTIFVQYNSHELWSWRVYFCVFRYRLEHDSYWHRFRCTLISVIRGNPSKEPPSQRTPPC